MNKDRQNNARMLLLADIVHPHAAGIDVGSRSHYVALGQDKKQVKEFGVFTQDLHQLCRYLVDNGITATALESTGSYWQPLFVLLQQYGLNPILVNGKYTKHAKGRKTDVKDSQWIQKLHTMGMLEGSFIPDLFTETVRQYYRHRQYLVESAAGFINKMQKALRLINIRLDAVLRDVMGRSGKDIIEAILRGERCARQLASLVQPTVKATPVQLEAALSGDWREEYIFELRHCYELYQYYHEKIDECDGEIQKLLTAKLELKQKVQGTGAAPIEVKKKKARKNEADIDLQQLAAGLTGGIDISSIEGIGLGFILCMVAETGLELTAFPTGKQFTSWLRLAPNLRITGSKVISSKTKSGKNRLARAFMYAANAIGNKKSGDYLVGFFKRIQHRKGRMVAVVATARKLAMIIWNMLVKKIPYSPIPTLEQADKIRKGQIKTLQRKIRQLGVKEGELLFV
jgi:transposase